MPELVKKSDKLTTVRDLVQRMVPYMAKTLPAHLEANRFSLLALTTIRKNPALLECSAASLGGAIFECARLGLEPVGPGGVWLVPFKQKGEAQVTVIADYRGLLDLVRRSGMYDPSFPCHVVYEKDEFDYAYAPEPWIKHKPYRGEDRGEVTAFYFIALPKGGGQPHIHVMERWQVEKHRDRFSRAADRGPWVTDFEAMGLKTVIRIGSKPLPMPSEFRRTVELDEKAEIGEVEDFEALLPDELRDGGNGGSRLEQVITEKKKQDEAKTNGKGGESPSASASTVTTSDTASPAKGASDAPPVGPATEDGTKSGGASVSPAGGAPTLSGLLDVLNTLYAELHKTTPPDKAKREREFLWSRYIGPGVDAEKADPVKVQKLIDELTKIRDKKSVASR